MKEIEKQVIPVRGRKIRRIYTVAAASAAVIASASSSMATPYTLSSFGVDTLSADLIALALLGFVASAGLVSLGLGGDVIFGLLMKWGKRAFGGR